jgi:hypothetical protein
MARTTTWPDSDYQRLSVLPRNQRYDMTLLRKMPQRSGMKPERSRMADRDGLSLEAQLAQVAMRDRVAFDALYRSTANRLFGICLRVLMVPVPSAPDSTCRVPELWLIAAGKAPVSLGAVSITQSPTVTVPQNARAALVAGSVLAITLGPASGIPHGAPTGAIVAKGTIQPLSSAG